MKMPPCIRGWDRGAVLLLQLLWDDVRGEEQRGDSERRETWGGPGLRVALLEGVISGCQWGCRLPAGSAPGTPSGTGSGGVEHRLACCSLRPFGLSSARLLPGSPLPWAMTQGEPEPVVSGCRCAGRPRAWEADPAGAASSPQEPSCSSDFGKSHGAHRPWPQQCPLSPGARSLARGAVGCTWTSPKPEHTRRVC